MPFGIYTGSGGATTAVAESVGPFKDFGNNPAINASGRVVFYATLDANSFGIFNGADPVANKLIGKGDALFGSTVTALAFDADGLNDADQVAFRYSLASGKTGLAVATLVPEPGAATLLLGGLVVLPLTGRRCRNQAARRSRRSADSLR